MAEQSVRVRTAARRFLATIDEHATQMIAQAYLSTFDELAPSYQWGNAENDDRHFELLRRKHKRNHLRASVRDELIAGDRIRRKVRIWYHRLRGWAESPDRSELEIGIVEGHYSTWWRENETPIPERADALPFLLTSTDYNFDYPDPDLPASHVDDLGPTAAEDVDFWAAWIAERYILDRLDRLLYTTRYPVNETHSRQMRVLKTKHDALVAGIGTTTPTDPFDLSNPDLWGFNDRFKTLTYTIGTGDPQALPEGADFSAAIAEAAGETVIDVPAGEETVKVQLAKSDPNADLFWRVGTDRSQKIQDGEQTLIIPSSNEIDCTVSIESDMYTVRRYDITFRRAAPDTSDESSDGTG